jgi:malonyl CoA-acyl carrier protein transacylase
VYKEEYIFEAQEEQWIELETSVSETTGEEIEVSAETTEFSLFAVTETISEQSQPNGSNNETATSSQNNSTGTTDQTPGFGIISVVISILLIVVALSRPRSDADG